VPNCWRLLPAAAIQNARLFARADIFASELQKRWQISTKRRPRWLKLKETGSSPRRNFRKFFVPVQFPSPSRPFKEGRFLDVNSAFERRYGYSREEVLGHTVTN